MSTTGGPEYLDRSGAPAPEPGNDNRRRLVITGGIVGAALVVGGGAWAVTSFFATGAQPAEALPASTIAYAGIDLDPSGGQKIEAIKMLRKFPAIAEEMDLETDDDLRERLFEEITSSGECEGLDYAADVEPWLGSRAALAAVESADSPVPALVMQVTDSGAAESGMETINDKCGGTADEQVGWVVDGDWAIISDSEEGAQDIVDQAAEADLASDDDFTRWTDEAGGDGIMTMYVAGSVVDHLDELTGAANGAGGLGDMGEMGEMGGSTPMTDEMRSAMESFEGAAMTMRFDDGALELEMAASGGEAMADLGGGADIADLMASLPDGTVAAFAMALPEGWVDSVADLAGESTGGGTSLEELYAQAEAQTGLELPEDLETLLGEGVAVALGEGIDPDAIANGGTSELPLGVKIKGDAGDIQAVLDKIKVQLPPEQADLLQVEDADGYAVLGLNDDFKATLAEDGDLGDNETYRDVVDDADAASFVVFVNFNADDDWLVRLAGDTPDVADNLEPLAAFGVSSWMDGDVGHGLVRLTTD